MSDSVVFDPSLPAGTTVVAAAAHPLLHYVISHARSAIAVHDRDLRYIYVSERYLQEYNVRETDVIGRHHYDVFPDLPQKWRDVHQRALAGEILSAEEDPYVRADRTTDWTRWECRPWYEADGSIGGIVIYTEVITDRKRAEEERKALGAQLLQANKMEAIGRLAGGVAHDFNNLLTSILGNIELALMELAPDNGAVPLLCEAGRSAEAAANLTRQLLAFSRKQIIEPRPTDLSGLVRHLRTMLTRLIGEDVVLHVRADNGVPAVRVDRVQFEQVLVNLAANARDAMPEGGQLTIETREVVLDAVRSARLPEAPAGHYVMLSVADTGHGMDDEAKRHVFEPFYTTKPQGRGTGLGLATVFGAVKQAGGFIDVESEVGKGTTFRIYLPPTEAAAEEVDRYLLAKTMPPGQETVLVVEDDPQVRELTVRILRRLGYSVIHAGDGEQALQIAERLTTRIDLLLTDIVMPGMDGAEVARRARALHPEAKVLYSSGYTDNDKVRRAVFDRNAAFIAKPYRPEALARKIREVLDTGGEC